MTGTFEDWTPRSPAEWPPPEVGARLLDEDRMAAVLASIYPGLCAGTVMEVRVARIISEIVPALSEQAKAITLLAFRALGGDMTEAELAGWGNRTRTALRGLIPGVVEDAAPELGR